MTDRPSPPRAAGRRAALGALLGATVLAAGCAGPDPARYAADKPVLDLRSYFDGDVDAWGMFQDRSGAIVRRFTVHIRGTWDGDVGTLDERFTYSDGARERRVWTLRRQADGRWTGTAADVVGEASGVASGSTLTWRYTLALVVDGRTWHVDLDDRMVLVDERTLLNRATMSKLGVHLGDVVLSFRRR